MSRDDAGPREKVVLSFFADRTASGCRDEISGAKPRERVKMEDCATGAVPEEDAVPVDDRHYLSLKPKRDASGVIAVRETGDFGRIAYEPFLRRGDGCAEGQDENDGESAH